MIKYLRIIKTILFILFVVACSIAFSFKKEIISTFKVFNFYIERNLAIKSNKFLVDTTLHDLRLKKISIKSLLGDYD